MTKHIIETSLLQGLLNVVTESIHPSRPVGQILKLIEDIKSDAKLFNEADNDTLILKSESIDKLSKTESNDTD